MKIGVISDTHDNLHAISKAVELFNKEKVEIVLHAGDFVAPFTLKILNELKCKLVGVFGNNDGDRIMLKKMSGDNIFNSPHTINLADKKVIISHDLPLEELIQSQCYDLIVYGHSHNVDSRIIDRTMVINPGECGGWLSGNCTVAICDIIEKKTDIITL
ncbi:metallophosphoesterase [Thermodesulfobacteriota bacterium]